MATTIFNDRFDKMALRSYGVLNDDVLRTLIWRNLDLASRIDLVFEEGLEYDDGPVIPWTYTATESVEIRNALNNLSNVG